MVFCTFSPAQNVGQTIRHHRVAEDESYGPALQKAEAAIDAKDYAAAESELQKLTESQPENYRIWFDLGLIYSQTNRDQQAIEAYKKAVAADPQVFESQLNLGLLMARAGLPEAAEHLRAATTLDPASDSKDAMATTWLALAQVVQKTNPGEALAAYQKASGLRPADAKLHLAAGSIAEQLKNWSVAEHEYLAAKAGDAGNEQAVSGLVNVYLATRQFAKAEPLLRDLLKEKPSDRSLRLLLGRLLMAQGRLDEARPELEAGLEGSQDTKARRDLAQLDFDAKQYDKAAEQLKILLQQTPNDAEARAMLGSALLYQKHFPEAQAELLAAVKLKPDMAGAYNDLAMAASENKDYILTIRALDARAQLKPDQPGTYFLRAIAYDHLKDYVHASENYHRFLEVADGKFPDQEWLARQRLKVIEPRKSR
jgi:Flp pilus assembly protein TadD